MELRATIISHLLSKGYLMAQLVIERDVDLSDEKVASLKQRVSDELSGHGIVTEWSGDRARVDSHSVKGECLLSKSRVEIDLKLDFMASMFKAKIEDRLCSYLDDLE